MSIFNDLKRAIEFSGRPAVAARVTAADAVKMTVTVEIEGESVEREAVPLRIFTDEDSLGAVIIPRIDTEVLIAFIDGDESRPQVIKVQQWEQVILRKGPAEEPSIEITIDSENKVDMRKASGFQFTIDSEDKVSIGNAPSHKVAWGDKWLTEFNQHTHPTPTGPSGPPMQPLIDNQVNSQIFKVE